MQDEGMRDKAAFNNKSLFSKNLEGEPLILHLEGKTLEESLKLLVSGEFLHIDMVLKQ